MADLDLARVFLAVYRAGSISAAAPRLNRTQPGVSKQLRAFERQVQRTLFTRLPRGIAPTPAAHALAEVLGPHLDALDAALGATLAGASALDGIVLLGGPAEFLDVMAVPALGAAITQGVQIRCVHGVPRELVAAVASEALDLVIATQRVPTRGVRFEALYEERFVLVGAPRWAERLSPHALRHDGATVLSTVPLVAYDADLPLVRRYWREVFGAPRPKRAAVTVPDLRSVVRAVVAGLGVSVVPRYLASEALANGALTELLPGARVTGNTLWLAWRSGDATPRTTFVRELLVRAVRGAER
ncbi:MAG: LysR family transcriptional regulator [Gemmatimonadaceae bacterium]|jgi:DNA-binding transcriptional LysR family regulator|nr:LysR family transcriptional regulator [Gemmatimonadaceae bacterium]